jgi:hypothetical protein
MCPADPPLKKLPLVMTDSDRRTKTSPSPTIRKFGNLFLLTHNKHTFSFSILSMRLYVVWRCRVASFILIFIEKSEVREGEELEVYVPGRLGQPTVQLVNCSGICARKGFEVFFFLTHVTKMKMLYFEPLNMRMKLKD